LGGSNESLSPSFPTASHAPASHRVVSGLPPHLAMCGGGVRGCWAVLAVLALVASAVIAFLEGTAGGVSYAGEGWFHECAKWDAEGARFLASTFLGGGVAEVRGDGGEERVVVADPDVAGRVALGLVVDAPRRRVLVAYADRPPRFGYAALGAYELGSWRRLFLTRLDAPGTCAPSRAYWPPLRYLSLSFFFWRYRII
jgi:hypothetical protein